MNHQKYARRKSYIEYSNPKSSDTLFSTALQLILEKKKFHHLNKIENKSQKYLRYS